MYPTLYSVKWFLQCFLDRVSEEDDNSNNCAWLQLMDKYHIYFISNHICLGIVMLIIADSIFSDSEILGHLCDGRRGSSNCHGTHHHQTS